MNSDSIINKLILNSAYVVIIVLIIAVIALLILKYQVEGEQNMPFNLSSILVISSAEGYQETESNEYKWDVEVIQNNDIYLNIEKNKNYKDTELIKSVKIENIKINEEPRIGKIKLYRNANNETQLFEYKEEYEINDNIEYFGDVESDFKNLKISNQGGTIVIRIVNTTGKNYTSNEEELEHSGKLLEKAEIEQENIQFNILFDLVIKLETDISFRTTIQLDLPSGKIAEEGSSSMEINDKKEIVFKREQ